jgi:predicted dienelactone hydrolase
MQLRRILIISLLGLAAARAPAEDIPSRPGIDTPELAATGTLAVGVRTITLVHKDQVDPLGWLGIAGAVVGLPPHADRNIAVDIWYPAEAVADAQAETYHDSLPAEPPAPDAAFSVPGMAVRDAPALKQKSPLVVVSHGYGNVTAGLTWLTENLATKGYVVAAIRHEDPYNDGRVGFPKVLLRRPLDIGFVARSLQQRLSDEGLVDPMRTALVGYSMGGYGVLTSSGAVLDTDGPIAKATPGGLLEPYGRNGTERDAVLVQNLKAVVAIAPAGGGSLSAWGSEGLRGIHAPLLLISGNHDQTVDYSTGAKAFFEGASDTTRYLLTYREGGHAIGLGPAPAEMRQDLWNTDWFEDPVWRKDRIIGINLHFITAFLDRYVKDDASRASYLELAVTDAAAGTWPQDQQGRWNEISPGTEGITVWKGFQRRHAQGLEWLRQDAAAATR